MKKLALLNAKDLRNKKPAEISNYIKDVKTAQRDFAHLVATNKEKQTHKFNAYRKAIAKANTILVEAWKEEQ